MKRTFFFSDKVGEPVKFLLMIKAETFVLAWASASPNFEEIYPFDMANYKGKNLLDKHLTRFSIGSDYIDDDYSLTRLVFPDPIPDAGSFSLIKTYVSRESFRWKP